ANQIRNRILRDTSSSEHPPFNGCPCNICAIFDRRLDRRTEKDKCVRVIIGSRSPIQRSLSGFCKKGPPKGFLCFVSTLRQGEGLSRKNSDSLNNLSD